MSINILSRDARSSSLLLPHHPDYHTDALRTMNYFIKTKTTTIVHCVNTKNSNINHLAVFSFIFKKNTAILLKKQSTTIFLL
jgi:hypothetical protein